MLKYTLIGAGALLLLAAAGVGIWLAVWHPYLIFSPPKYDIMARDDFKSCWQNAHPESLLNVYGPPRRRYSLGGMNEAWVYSGITYDPVTRRRDGQVEFIILADRVVTEIRFP